MPSSLSREVLIVLILIFALPTPGPAGAELELPGQRLREIIAAYWTDLLKTHPLEATVFVGDHRFSDRLDDPSASAYQGWLDRLDSTRKALEAIDPRQLTAEERLDREILLTTLESRLQARQFGDHLVPLAPIVRYASDLHFADLHLLFAQLGEFHPASTRGDLENYLLRLRAFPTVVDRIIATLTQGMAEGRMSPRVVMPRIVTQLRSLSRASAKESPFWAIIPRLPDDWLEADRQATSARIKEAIEKDVIPAYARLAEFVETTYLPACPDRVGLCAERDGSAHYAWLVRDYTTTDLTPDQIHKIGLAEMAKTVTAMESIRKHVKFDGDLKAFFAADAHRTRRFKNRSDQQILNGHRAIIATMEPNLPRLFGACRRSRSKSGPSSRSGRSRRRWVSTTPPPLTALALASSS